MPKERPRIIVVKQNDDHGCLITLLLLIVAWPLAIAYWILRLVAWILGLVVGLLTLPLRRRGRRDP